MKEAYETPQLEIIEFEAEDVITTSGEPSEPSPEPTEEVTPSPEPSPEPE